jgi:type III secretion protein J
MSTIKGSISRLIAVLILLGAIGYGLLMRRTVLAGLSETESREVAVALDKGGVRSFVSKDPKGRGQTVEETWSVEIHGSDRTQVEAWRILQEHNLPRPREAGIADVYKDGQLIPTASEERAKFALAMSGELGRSLKSVPGIADARVHVVIPDPSALRDPATKPHPTASVLVKYTTSERPLSKESVANLVSKGIEGLETSNVEVEFVRLPIVAPDPRRDLQGMLPSPGLFLDYVIVGVYALLIYIGLQILTGPVVSVFESVKDGMGGLMRKA